MVGYFNHLTTQPAYRRVSGADSSYASDLNHAKYAGRVNNSIDYYDKGMLVAFGVDATLRTEVAGGEPRAMTAPDVSSDSPALIAKLRVTSKSS